jgi:hypothetical protein
MPQNNARSYSRAIQAAKAHCRSIRADEQVRERFMARLIDADEIAYFVFEAFEASAENVEAVRLLLQQPGDENGSR